MTPSVSTLLAVASILGCLPSGSCLSRVKVQMERFEQVGGEGIADCSKLRVCKYNRTVFALDGTLHFLKDLDSSYEFSVRVAYSSLGNNQFNEYPMKVPRKQACQFMVDEYADFQHMWANCSNLPQLAAGTSRYCPVPKGAYWIRDLVPDASFIPPVVPAGLWRMTWEFLRPSDVVVMQLRFFYRITKGM